VENTQIELKTYRAELHLHTVLSPCAAVEMIPPLIIQEAEEKGINLIAVSDHNAIENISAVMQAAHGTTVTVLPAMELQTREEIHSLCLFDTLEQITDFYDRLRPTFPEIRNNVDYFGEQFVVDATGDFVRREERLLITSSSLSLKDAWELTTDHGGLLIPAHINRSAFGLIPILGFIPKDIPLEVLEISNHINPEQARANYPQLTGYYLIQNGDAHQLSEIAGFNRFHIAEPSIAEFKLAFHRSAGRFHELIASQNAK
jgi:PHP family Zn ribbon phosphoesterase